MRVTDEVRETLASNGAVVALETTLVAHGFPPGEGVEVGLASERAVREGGAVPATIGVLDGEAGQLSEMLEVTSDQRSPLRQHNASDKQVRTAHFLQLSVRT